MGCRDIVLQAKGLYPQSLEEMNDLAVCQLRLLELHEMSSLRNRLEIQIVEVVTQAISPPHFQHRVASAPPDARRGVNFRKARGAITDKFNPRAVQANIPIEPTLEIARFEEIVHPCIYILVECMRIARPMAEKMTNIVFAGLPVRADEVCSPWLLVE